MNTPQRCSWTVFTLLLLLVLLASGRANAQTNAVISGPRRPVTRFGQVFGLTQRDASQALPVEINAWVIASDPAPETLWLRDASGGWELTQSGYAINCQAGQQVFLEAKTRWSGSCADLDEVRLSIQKPIWPPKRINPGDRLSLADAMDWANVEGVVEFMGADTGGAVLDVSARGHHLEVHVLRANAGTALGLLRHRVRLRGLVQGVITPEGDVAFGRMWVDGFDAVQIIEPTIEDWRSSPLIPAAQLQVALNDSHTNSESRLSLGSLLRVSGRIEGTNGTGFYRLVDATGEIRVRLPAESAVRFGEAAEVLGIFGQKDSVAVLLCGCLRTDVSPQTPLTTIEQIHRLKPDEAQRGYPVRVRGVATGGFAYIQDATRGISVSNALGRLEFGGYYQIEGQTGSGLYAPVIEPTKITYLGVGQLPQPIHPTWERLASGSEVCQWVELKGMVVSATEHSLTLAIQGGRVEAEVQARGTNRLSLLENAVVRIRGTCRSEYNVRRQLTRFWIDVPSPAFVSLEDPPRSDPFNTESRSIGEILQFDVDAYQIRRMKVTGQISYHAGRTGFMDDGTNAIRYSLRDAATLVPGDAVEIVGFPEAGAFSPTIREALWHQLDHHTPPVAPLCTLAELSHGERNFMRVRIRGELLAANSDSKESVLTLLSEGVVIAAQVQLPRESAVSADVGSKVEITGVWTAEGSRNGANRTNTFELLVQSPADVVVLERPSWWTFKHSLQVIGVLAAGLVLALAWIHLLRTQVAERTRQLKAQMQETERTERQRSLEQERSRIARDLHDNLGSSLTEISMLAETGHRSPAEAEKPQNRFRQILDRAQVLVRALDETVWAVDPGKDTLPSLVRYLAGFAEEFVSSAGIRCRVEVPETVPEFSLTTDLRHDLFLATKEALNNAVSHAQPTQVTFRVTIEGRELRIRIIDDGKGFDPNSPAPGNGVRNLRERLSGSDRRCEIESRPGVGTTVLLAVTLPVTEVSRAL